MDANSLSTELTELQTHLPAIGQVLLVAAVLLGVALWLVLIAVTRMLW